MALHSVKRQLAPKKPLDQYEGGVSASSKAKRTPKSSQQFGGVGERTDQNVRTLSKKAKRKSIHEFKGPRRRPIE